MRAVASTSPPRRRVLPAIVAVWLALGSALAVAAESVTLGALHLTSHAAGFIAQERTYFEAEGLDVALRFFSDDDALAAAVAAGDVDFGVVAVTPALADLASAGRVAVIGGVLTEAPGIDGYALLASDTAYAAGFTSAVGLAGRRLGVIRPGSPGHYLAHRIAVAEGIDPRDIELVALGRTGAMAVALVAGKVDALIAEPRLAARLHASGDAHVLARVNAYDDYQASVLVTAAATASALRDRVERFVRAYARGVADFDTVMVERAQDDTHVELMTRVIHKFVDADEPYEKAAAGIRDAVMRLQPDLRLNLTSLRRQLDWLAAQALVAAPVDAARLVEPGFVQTY